MPDKQIHSLKELKQLQKTLANGQKFVKTRVLICMTGCRALGASDVSAKFREQLQVRSLDKEVKVVETGCIGMCAQAPVMLIEPYGFLYGGVSPEDVEEIISQTIESGKPVKRLAVRQSGKPVPKVKNIEFYSKQTRQVLKNCGRIDPKEIEDAIERGEYAAAAKALTKSTPEKVIDEVTKSGLRGRGGAGFSTGIKWGFCRKSPGTEKYLICNADEGDPGAFMDRALLEGDPHRVIEGMVISAYAIGASQGFIYVRAEYPIAVEHIGIAIKSARKYGFLGNDIFGSGFDFDIEVRMGAGAFVCGEETALIASLEGNRGTPRTRPPFPAVSGYHGKPTNINNVETFANIPIIITGGAENYASTGTEGSKGTKIFALAGRVANTGLVEVPMGATLRQIVFEIGGGIPLERKFKAAQLGGPSGGCIPAKYLDHPLDYDSVEEIGAIMGSGGLVVMDENTCMVDVAKYFLEFVQAESCGKCTPCRVGTKKMLAILEAVSRGEAALEDLDELERLAKHIKKTSLCGLGQTAPNPVLSTLRHFRDEYVEHIVLKKCRAAVCEALVRSPCQHACPAGVNAPEYLALASEKRFDEAANIIRRRNPFVSVCGRVCDHPCEKRCKRSEIDQPLAIRAVKRYISDHMKNYDRLTSKPATGKSEVAIIGSGPAGLSCAYFLALMQRPSVVFEKQPIPGGMLSLGIPEFRLPKEILYKEIDFILSHGIELRTSSEVNSAKELLDKGYKAVFIGSGAQQGKSITIDGIENQGVIDALAFLRDRSLGKGLNCEGKKIIVLGGGNAAVDAARCAMRLGAEKVTILYRRTREEMPAYEEEIEEALREGIEIVTLSIPTRIISKNGCLTGIEFFRAELGTAGEDGRRRPVPVSKSETIIECDIVIPGIGQVSSIETARFDEGPELTDWNTINVNPVTLATSVPEIFSGGDCVTGPSTVIEAIAAGQRAAISIDKLLGGSGTLPNDVGFSFTKPDDEELAKAPPRAKEKTVRLKKQQRGFAEVILGFGNKQALAEAGRCLRCDLEK